MERDPRFDPLEGDEVVKGAWHRIVTKLVRNVVWYRSPGRPKFRQMSVPLWKWREQMQHGQVRKLAEGNPTGRLHESEPELQDKWLEETREKARGKGFVIGPHGERREFGE